jgi:formylmethanofuran dehydrogenase subunit E
MEDAVKFHGHLCPMSVLGVRMGRLALKKLARGRERGVRLVAVVEFKNCMADGIQYATGATYGKNTLFLNDYGKFAASFYDLGTKESVRIKVRNDVVEEALVFGRGAQDVKKLPPADREKEAKGILEKGREIAEKIGKLSDDELFEITEAPPFKPEEEPSLKHTVCEECGEIVLEDFIREKDGKNVCIGCLES